MAFTTNIKNPNTLFNRGVSSIKNYFGGIRQKQEQLKNQQPIQQRQAFSYQPPKLPGNIQIPQVLSGQQPTQQPIQQSQIQQPNIQAQSSAIQQGIQKPIIQQPTIQPQPQIQQPQPSTDYMTQLEAIKTGLNELKSGLTTITPITKEDSLSKIEKEITTSQTPTQEETEAEKQLGNLITSRELGLQAISEKPIAMPFITGQQAAIERRAAIQTLPLQQRIAQLQGKRQAALDVAKTKLGIEKERKEEKPIEVSGRLVDPITGKVIYEAPTETKAPTTIETDKGIKQWNSKTGQWEDTGFVKPTPAGVLEKQAEKGLEKQEVDTARQQQATQSLGVVNDLLSNPSLTTIFGYLGGRIGGIVPGKAQLALNQFNQLKSQLALGARQLIKGSGTISDYESRVLSQSTTALGRTLSDKDATQALKNVRGVLKTNIGQETPVRVYDINGKIIGEGNLTGKDIFEAISDGNRIEYQ